MPIQKFNSTGGFLTKWGSSGTDDGQFNNPPSVLPSTPQEMYMLLIQGITANSRIQQQRWIHSPNGVLLEPMTVNSISLSVLPSTHQEMSMLLIPEMNVFKCLLKQNQYCCKLQRQRNKWLCTSLSPV